MSHLIRSEIFMYFELSSQKLIHHSNSASHLLDLDFGYRYIFKKLYPNLLDTDTFSKSCIQIHWIQLQLFALKSNPEFFRF